MEPSWRGHFSGTLNSVSIGLTKDGYRLRWAWAYDNIDRSDGYGAQNLIESFLEGVSVQIGGIFLEWRAGVMSSVSPWNTWAVSGATSFDLGIIARAATNVATSLVLTATTGTPAAAAPATLTAASALIAAGFNVEPLLGPTHRETPFMFQLYPYTASSNTRYFSAT